MPAPALHRNEPQSPFAANSRSRPGVRPAPEVDRVRVVDHRRRASRASTRPPGRRTRCSSRDAARGVVDVLEHLRAEDDVERRVGAGIASIGPTSSAQGFGDRVEPDVPRARAARRAAGRASRRSRRRAAGTGRGRRARGSPRRRASARAAPARAYAGHRERRVEARRHSRTRHQARAASQVSASSGRPGDEPDPGPDADRDERASRGRRARHGRCASAARRRAAIAAAANARRGAATPDHPQVGGDLQVQESGRPTGRSGAGKACVGLVGEPLARVVEVRAVGPLLARAPASRPRRSGGRARCAPPMYASSVRCA